MQTNDLELFHYGVKGMKWGVRRTDAQLDRAAKARDSSSSSSNSSKPIFRKGDKWAIYDDGSIELKKGAQIQRVARQHKGMMGGVGEDLGLKGATYASFTPEDNASYEHGFGRSKGLLVKDASKVLKFSATKDLRSPAPKDATKTYLDLLDKDPDLKSAVQKGLGPMWNVDKAIKDPSGDRAYDLYSVAYDAGNYNSKFKDTNSKFNSALTKQGYNMLMDPTDSSSGFDAPVVILDGSGSMKLTASHTVDKVSQKKVRQVVKDHAKTYEGRSIIEKLGY